MNDLISKLRKPNLPKWLLKKILSIFFFEQWILLLGKNISETNPSWDDFIRIPPPPDRIWADPFIWKRDGGIYIFFEEQPLSTKRGRINYMAISDNLEIVETKIVIEQPYHLSYPFLFEWDGVLYMLPETKENRTIEVYRCLRFPHRWEKVKNLMSGIQAVDATLLEANGKWWLFTNMATDGGSTWDSLYLFYADHPLSDHWVPHPHNPIVQDIRTARPAGRIFYHSKGLIRPSQDCSTRYGYAINFNRIDCLSESEYAETLVWKFQPTQKEILATHTWNNAENLYAIDAKILRSKF